MLIRGAKMRIIVVVTILIALSLEAAAKTGKKSKDESATSVLNKKLLNKSKPKTPPAIIAIEIVDPNENRTRNSKRTIDSSLGYGYYQGAPSPPKYEVYKYSQHDIPPFRGSSHLFTGGGSHHPYEIQKSIEYHLPTQHSYEPPGHSYQPGTTLFSTLNQQGQAGGLTSHRPLGNDPQVPVIILRVFPNQLNDPSAILHPKLPSTHPLASAVNGIDIQSLLNQYMQQYQQQHQVQQHQVQQQPEYPDYQYEQPQSQDYQYQYQDSYLPQNQQDQHQYQQQDGLLTHENYPKETHTRVIFRTDKNKAGISPVGSSAYEHDTKTIKIHLPSDVHESFSQVQVQTPEMQYSYNSQSGQSSQDYNYYPQSSEANIQDSSYYQPQSQQYQSQDGLAYQYYQQQQQQQDYGDVSGGTSVEQPQHVATEEDVAITPKPFNYHAHHPQKRSKKRKSRLSVVGSKPKDITLETIKA